MTQEGLQLEGGVATVPLFTTWFRVIDCEATGPDPATDRAIEVAFQDVSGTGQLGMAFHSLINPGQPISPLASAVHHLIDEDVRSAPTLEQLRPELVTRIPTPSGDAPAPVFVAHNADFDRQVLGLPADALVLCTYRLAKHIWPELAGHGNEELRYQLQLQPNWPRGQSHRAQADVATTLSILLAALPHVRAKWPGLSTPGELAKRVLEPCQLAYVPFHPKGRRFDDEDAVEDSLLDWILRKQAGGSDCIHTAEREIERRRAARLARFRRPIAEPSAEDDGVPF